MKLSLKFPSLARTPVLYSTYLCTVLYVFIYTVQYCTVHTCLICEFIKQLKVYELPDLTIKMWKTETTKRLRARNVSSFSVTTYVRSSLFWNWTFWWVSQEKGGTCLLSECIYRLMLLLVMMFQLWLVSSTHSPLTKLQPPWQQKLLCGPFSSSAPLLPVTCGLQILLFWYVFAHDCSINPLHQY